MAVSLTGYSAVCTDRDWDQRLFALELYVEELWPETNDEIEDLTPLFRQGRIYGRKLA